VPLIEQAAPGVPNARWIAIRLLDGDAQVEEALRTGRLATLADDQHKQAERFSRKIALEGAQ
jgi:ferrous iron transport protein B